MNVFDFDGTLYDGDSSTDFFKWCYRKRPSLIRFLPKQSLGFLGYHLFKIDKARMKQYYFCFFKAIDTLDMVEKFWDERMDRIAPWYKDIHKDDDLVISASPTFLVEAACRRMGIKNVIASKVDPATGKFSSKNCRDVEKIARLHEIFPDAEIDDFYSDSDADLPLARMSKRAFKVIDMKVTEWDVDFEKTDYN